MRYIHDGTLRNRTVEPPVLFVVDEANTHGTGRTDTALQLVKELSKVRKTADTPLLIGHEPDRDRDTESGWRRTDR